MSSRFKLAFRDLQGQLQYLACVDSKEAKRALLYVPDITQALIWSRYPYGDGRLGLVGTYGSSRVFLGCRNTAPHQATMYTDANHLSPIYFVGNQDACMILIALLNSKYLGSGSLHPRDETFFAYYAPHMTTMYHFVPV